MRSDWISPTLSRYLLIAFVAIAAWIAFSDQMACELGGGRLRAMDHFAVEMECFYPD